jgi:hypothetical protein
MNDGNGQREKSWNANDWYLTCLIDRFSIGVWARPRARLIYGGALFLAGAPSKEVAMCNVDFSWKDFSKLG